jgi:flagellar motor switch protein FliN/FliY
MPQSQDEIDSLLAEMNDLANEAAQTLATEEPPDSAASGKALKEPTPAPPYPPPSPAPARTKEDPQRILKLQVPVIVELAACEMSLAEILNLSTGAIIEFEKPFDAPLQLKINNKTIGLGQAVKVGEKFGLRIAEIGSVTQRIKAMGGS